MEPGVERIGGAAARRERGVAAAIAAAGIVLGLAIWPLPAHADHLDNTPNWPGLLPPNPFNSAQTISPGFDVCPSGSIQCPRDVILEMYERWRPLNASCDHRAVFALTYLRTTEEFFRTIEHQPDFFADGPWVNHEDAVFADLYFRAYDQRTAGEEIPEAWRIAFDAAESDDVTAIGDLLLGMNAHINRDLPFTLAAVGLVPEGGGSHKLDHDRVNFFLQRVADPLQEELGRRYDELFVTTDGSPSPFDEQAVLEMVRGFRENAWRNAERLVNAADDAERAQVAQSIEAQATLGAQQILAANTIPGYGATRDAWCREHLEPSYRLKIRDHRVRRMLDRGRMRFRISSDGPADVRLRGKLLPAVPSSAGAEARSGSRAHRITRSRRLHVAAAGKRRGAVQLLPRAKSLLEARQQAKLKLVLRAPGKLRVRAVRTLR